MEDFLIPIHHRIYMLRGKQIMLGNDLDEDQNMRSQFVTSCSKQKIIELECKNVKRWGGA